MILIIPVMKATQMNKYNYNLNIIIIKYYYNMTTIYKRLPTDIQNIIKQRCYEIKFSYDYNDVINEINVRYTESKDNLIKVIRAFDLVEQMEDIEDLAYIAHYNNNILNERNYDFINNIFNFIDIINIGDYDEIYDEMRETLITMGEMGKTYILIN